MLKIGLTGGIGAGKTIVSDVFAALDVPIIDADRVGRDLLQSGSPCLAALVHQLGPDILSSDGSLQRGKLKSQMFAQEQIRSQVESILHPAIKLEMLAQLSTIHSNYCLLVVPLLIEKHWEPLVDRVLLVNAPESMRIERVLKRDHLNTEQIQQIVNSQMSQTERLKRADDIIDNDKDIAYVTQQVNALHKKYLNAALVD